MQLDTKMRILIVDDYATTLPILRNSLKLLGFENVDEASNGQAALKLIGAIRYDLVIADWNTTPVTGHDLLRALKSNPDTAATKFIMINAQSCPETMITAKRAGANNYIIKPFTAQILQEKIETAFQKQVA